MSFAEKKLSERDRLSFGRRALSDAIRAKNVKMVKDILNGIINIADILNETFEIQSPIEEAIKYGNVAIVDAIIDKLFSLPEESITNEFSKKIRNKQMSREEVVALISAYNRRGPLLAARYGQTTRKIGGANKRGRARRSTRQRKHKHRKNN